MEQVPDILPDHYKDKSLDGYVADVIHFLEQSQWIYEFQLTRFFIERVWENIPEEWYPILFALTTDELNELPFYLYNESWPTSFKQWLTAARQLALLRQQVKTNPVTIPKDVKRGMNPKKQHEVSHMASIVQDVCAGSQCDMVVDVGAGLGYLGQLIHLNSGLNVLSLESKDSRTDGADRRTQKLDLPSNGVESVTFELQDNQDAMKNFEKLIQNHSQIDNIQTGNICDKEPHICSIDSISNQQNSSLPSEIMRNSSDGNSLKKSGDTITVLPSLAFPDTNSCVCQDDKRLQQNPVCRQCKLMQTDEAIEDQCKLSSLKLSYSPRNMCMIGLHSCADLTPTMLKCMVHIPCFKSMVCVGCCYHNMSFNETRGFSNFPMSSLVGSYLQRHSTWRMSKFGMRLAAQETRARWRSQTSSEHEQHMRSVAYRAILEEVLAKGNQTCQKLKRKVARKQDFESFEKYVNAVLVRVVIDDGTEPFKSSLKDTMTSIYTKHKEHFKYIEIITALQVILQPVIESLILIDRVVYLREHELKAKLVPIFDDNISPRNMAIVVESKQ